MNFQIREATPADVPAIHQLIIELAIYEKEPDAVEATTEDLHAALFSDSKSKVGKASAYAHVATVEDEVVGIAIWFLNYSTWQGVHGVYLEDLYVTPEHRGSGIGKALLKTLAKLCVERGYGRFQWWVLDWNKPSIDFYEAHGAVAMDEWTVYRLTGDALKKMATDDI
jgi:GNAT superfamily N-acetyltransferase